jgi:hypothetical protein
MKALVLLSVTLFSIPCFAMGKAPLEKIFAPDCRTLPQVKGVLENNSGIPNGDLRIIVRTVRASEKNDHSDSTRTVEDTNLDIANDGSYLFPGKRVCLNGNRYYWIGFQVHVQQKSTGMYLNQSKKNGITERDGFQAETGGAYRFDSSNFLRINKTHSIVDTKFYIDASQEVVEASTRDYFAKMIIYAVSEKQTAQTIKTSGGMSFDTFVREVIKGTKWDNENVTWSLVVDRAEKECHNYSTDEHMYRGYVWFFDLLEKQAHHSAVLADSVNSMPARSEYQVVTDLPENFYLFQNPQFHSGSYEADCKQTFAVVLIVTNNQTKESNSLYLSIPESFDERSIGRRDTYFYAIEGRRFQYEAPFLYYKDANVADIRMAAIDDDREFVLPTPERVRSVYQMFDESPLALVN